MYIENRRRIRNLNLNFTDEEKMHQNIPKFKRNAKKREHFSGSNNRQATTNSRGIFIARRQNSLLLLADSYNLQALLAK